MFDCNCLQKSALFPAQQRAEFLCKPVFGLLLSCKVSKSFMSQKMSNVISDAFMVARLSILIGTPSIFESLILKQIDLYCKTIDTWITIWLSE